MKYFLLLALFILGACGSVNKLEDRQGIVPAATGDVATKADDNGNTQMLIRVKHLAEPSKLMDGANNYVVWVQPQGSPNFQNVGTLKVDRDLEAEYRTSVPYKAFNLMITPEVSPGAQAPTGPAVLQKTVTM